MSFFPLASIGIFGLIGIFLRYGLEQWFAKPGGQFPWATLITNALGCFIAGGVYSLGVERQWLSAETRTALLVGFAGGFTTFSAYALQTVLQWHEDRVTAVVYLFVSPALGLVAILIGQWLGRTYIS